MPHADVPDSPRHPDPQGWPERRERLVRGLWNHLVIFVLVAPLLFMSNWITIGEDGSWWIVWVLQLWAVAGGLHVFGVSLEFSRHTDER